MLEDYARRNGFPRPTHFTDDGISGTRFDRPGFMAMMAEVEAGNVEAIIVKDMSRLGRDYLKVGQVMETLRQKNVRLIALNDGVDSFRGDDDFTPFLNIMNEWYARDISKKIRSTFQAKGKAGRHLTGTVIYGYLWDESRRHWLVDEEAAAVVRRIFAMSMDGYGPYQIARRLSAEKVEIPSIHLARHGEGVNKNKAVKDPYAWGSSVIVSILKKREYLGHKISDMNSSYYDLRGKIVQAERRIATLTERGEMWAQYNKYKPIRKQLAKVKPEKRELFEQRHSRELILYDAAARYLKELKGSGEEITPKAWQREIDLLTAQKQVDTIDMKAMREELKAVERLRKAADQLARQGQDKSHDRGPER